MDSIFNDVNRLIDLAKKNPGELERLRLREIENLIDNAPQHLQRRLRGLQFQIDCKRRIHSHPMGACIAISRMMLDSLHELNKAVHGHTSTNQPDGEAKQSIRVIPFPATGN